MKGPGTRKARGPAGDLTRELGKRLGVPVKVTPAPGVNGVLQSVKNGEADIGFLAYDSLRAMEVDFSQAYSLGQNSFIVLENSPLKSVKDIDKAGLKLGVTQGDAGDLFLTRNLKNAMLTRNRGSMDAALAMVLSREVDAYGTNRHRLYELTQRSPGLRLLPDNFYAVEQSIIVRQSNKALLDAVNRFLDDARSSGLVAASVRDAGIIGVDVAPKR